MFCSQDALVPIKSYSPELMVAPFEYAAEFTSTGHAIVMGPGLGREEKSFEALQTVLKRQSDIVHVMDGDALWFLSEYHQSIQIPQNCILTPNAMEFRRLWVSLVGPDVPPFETENSSNCIEETQKLSRLTDCVIVRKGKVDVIASQSQVYVCDEQSGLRRCGGQGDVLAGLCGVFGAWAVTSKCTLFTAACMASIATRKLSFNAFKAKGRSMTASDLVTQIPQLVRNWNIFN